MGMLSSPLQLRFIYPGYRDNDGSFQLLFAGVFHVLHEHARLRPTPARQEKHFPQKAPIAASVYAYDGNTVFLADFAGARPDTARPVRCPGISPLLPRQESPLMISSRAPSQAPMEGSPHFDNPGYAVITGIAVFEAFGMNLCSDRIALRGTIKHDS